MWKCSLDASEKGEGNFSDKFSFANATLSVHFDRQIANSKYSHTLFVRPVPRELESMDEVKLAETRTAITVAIPENRGFLSHDCYLHVLFIDCLVVSR